MEHIEVLEDLFESLPEREMPVSNMSRTISDIARSPRRGIRQLQNYSFEELKTSIEEIQGAVARDRANHRRNLIIPPSSTVIRRLEGISPKVIIPNDDDPFI